MSRNLKLFFKYIYFNIPHFFLNQSKKGNHNFSLVLTKPTLYYTSLHLRFSSIFYLTQLVDIFAYENPVDNNNHSISGSHLSFLKKSSESCVVYNFHNLLFQDRYFLFAIDYLSENSNNQLNSIAELFPNSSWLEREVSELHGIIFNNKKDLRNLMLQYGDTTVPFQKSSPSVGYKELFYDSISDTLTESTVTLQV